MSTRARITITDGEVEQNFYRHSDGYPSVVMPSVGHFMRLVKRGNIRADVMQASGWLVAFGIKEHREHGYTGDLEPGPVSSMMGWKVGAYEPDPYPLHGDEVYRYILNLADKSIQIEDLSAGTAPVYAKGWEPVNGKCPTCGQKVKATPRPTHQWLVPSFAGEGEYVVSKDENDTWSCTCPDHTYRQHDCKHIFRIKSNLL